MKTYLAEFQEDGLKFCVSFDALSYRRAENIARKKGWTIVGEFIEDHECPDDVVAMIEKAVRNPSIH